VLRTQLGQCHFIVVLSLLAAPAARADYISVYIPIANEPVSGSVQIEAFDGRGASGGGLGVGDVRLSFRTYLAPGDFSPPGIWQHMGLRGIVFPTDLNVIPNQIAMPPGWSLWVRNGADQRYWISALADTIPALQPTVSILITGLGANASPAHFLDTAMPGSDISVFWDFADRVGTPVSTPEPATFVLGALGIAALLGKRILPSPTCRSRPTC
jgi:hypothetical protein